MRISFCQCGYTVSLLKPRVGLGATDGAVSSSGLAWLGREHGKCCGWGAELTGWPERAPGRKQRAASTLLDTMYRELRLADLCILMDPGATRIFEGHIADQPPIDKGEAAVTLSPVHL